jgi:type VI secretion system protein ImpC
MAEETPQGQAPEARESAAPPAADGGQTLSPLDRIILEGKMARDDLQRAYARDLIGEFVSQILDQGMTVSKDTVAMINHRIAQIDG